MRQEDRESCITSAATGTAGRRPLRRAAMATSWTSATTGSTRIATISVRTAFSCVASRNRVLLGTRTGPAGRENSASGVPPGPGGGRSALEPGCVGLRRRPWRIPMGVVDSFGEWQYSQLASAIAFSPDRPVKRPVGAVALPPGTRDTAHADKHPPGTQLQKRPRKSRKKAIFVV